MSRDGDRLRVLRETAFRVQDGRCYWCDDPMTLGAPNSDPHQATGDHLKRRVDGGRTVPGNIVAACRRCNNGRHRWQHRGVTHDWSKCAQ